MCLQRCNSGSDLCQYFLIFGVASINSVRHPFAKVLAVDSQPGSDDYSAHDEDEPRHCYQHPEESVDPWVQAELAIV